MARDLTGRVIVITGASSGIGAATALACARAGLDVVLHGRQADALARVADGVHQAGRAAELVLGDVTTPGLSAQLLDAAEARFGRCDVVFANAGYGLHSPMHTLDEAALRRIFEVNFFAATELLALAARRMIAAGCRGHLLMCSSAVARLTLPGLGAYSATKAAQHHVCRAMRMDLRGHGIAVSSVHPIGTRTPFFARAAEMSGQPRAAAQDIGGPAWTRQPPERVARAVVRCLRRRNPEVWTSFGVRFAAAVMTVFPRTMDALAWKGRRRD